MPKLTAKQRHFIDAVFTENCRTDAYLKAYKNRGGTRRTATANCSRVFNMPHVQEYYGSVLKSRIQTFFDRTNPPPRLQYYGIDLRKTACLG